MNYCNDYFEMIGVPLIHSIYSHVGLAFRLLDRATLTTILIYVTTRYARGLEHDCTRVTCVAPRTGSYRTTHQSVSDGSNAPRHPSRSCLLNSVATAAYSGMATTLAFSWKSTV
jgi:hypothetical protein